MVAPPKAKPAPKISHGIDAKTAFKERSSSLKPPTKVEVKESIKNFNKNQENDKPFFAFQNKPSGLDTKLKSNQSYCYPPKPPKISK